jgi:negative regulator of flagellin synthesis FlgM
MKINDSQRIGAVNPYKKVNETISTNSVGPKNKPKDQVEISTEAKELLGSLGSVRSEEQTRRLSELKNLVSSGTYHVESRKIAEKLFPYIK